MRSDLQEQITEYITVQIAEYATVAGCTVAYSAECDLQEQITEYITVQIAVYATVPPLRGVGG